MVEVGKRYRHFKGTTHKVLATCKHSETLEELIIYNHEDTGEIWARPIDLFTSEVDHEKYPDVKQKYRFEKIED